MFQCLYSLCLKGNHWAQWCQDNAASLFREPQLWWQDLASFIATASCAPNVKSALIWCRGYIFVLAMMGRIWKGANPQHSIWYSGFLAKGHQRPKSRRYMAGWPNIFKGDCSICTHPQFWNVLNMNHKKEPQVTCTIEALGGVVGIQPSFAAAITCMFHESTLLGVAWKGALLAPLKIETLQNDTVIFVQHALTCTLSPRTPHRSAYSNSFAETKSCFREGKETSKFNQSPRGG